MAICVVAVVEHRAHTRRLQIRGSNKTHVTHDVPRPMNLLFETHATEAPVCTKIPTEEVSYTLVSQCSDNRLWMMEHHCERWSGPISLAVYTNQTQQFVEQQLQIMRCSVSTMTLQIHPVDSLVDYPINALRNMAFRGVRTSHGVYVDVDFWPSRQLEGTLNLHRSNLAEDNQLALVIPAFMLVRQCQEWRECPEVNIPAMPSTQQDVFDGMMSRRIFPFDPTNRGGHGSTRYQDWLTQSEDKLLDIDCFQSRRYEPYLVVRYCQDLPPFQEGFTGYGKNKVSWVMQLRRAGWKFGQIGQGFVVHYPHLDSPARQAWNGDISAAESNHLRKTTMMRKPKDESLLMQTKRGANDLLFVEFKDWLDEYYPLDGQDGADSRGSMIRTPLCSDASDDDTKLWVSRRRLI